MQQMPPPIQDCSEKEEEKEEMTDAEVWREVDLWIVSWPEWEQRVAQSLLEEELSLLKVR